MKADFEAYQKVETQKLQKDRKEIDELRFIYNAKIEQLDQVNHSDHSKDDMWQNDVSCEIGFQDLSSV